LRAAADRGWVKPIVVGRRRAIRADGEAGGIALTGFTIVAPQDEIARGGGRVRCVARSP